VICRTVELPPIASGERMPSSGSSLATLTVDSPNASSAVRTFPLGRRTRLRSSAPRALAYQSDAASASGTTMCGVIVIAITEASRYKFKSPSGQAAGRRR
jgi:hypothetical protein